MNDLRCLVMGQKDKKCKPMPWDAVHLYSVQVNDCEVYVSYWIRIL